MRALTLRSSNQIKLTSTFRPAGTSVWCLNIKTAPFRRTAEARTDHRYQHVADLVTRVCSVMFPKSVSLASPSFSDVHFVTGPVC